MPRKKTYQWHADAETEASDAPSRSAKKRQSTALQKLGEQAGLSIHTDGIGNVRLRLRGRQPGPAVLVGSHLDSVRHGGSLDGKSLRDKRAGS